ncbi:MAG: hypothetical protein AB8G96_03070 [Phycisphaerales bacterium]
MISHRSVLAAPALVAAIAAGPSALGQFEGPYALSEWTNGGVSGGTTTIEEGACTVLEYSYDVDLGNPGDGVPFGTQAVFSGTIDRSGVLTFDCELAGFHAFAGAFAGVEVDLELDGVTTTFLVIPQQPVSSNFTLDAAASIPVEAGMMVTVRVIADNNDSNSVANGTLTLSNWKVSADDFVGPYDPGNWMSPQPFNGFTTIDPPPGESNFLAWNYDINEGNPGSGVLFQSMELTTTAAAADETITFDWTYDGFHSFFFASAGLQAIAHQPDGQPPVIVELVPFVTTNGAFSFAGTASIDVRAGQSWGLIASGENADSNSILVGDVVLTNLTATQRDFSGGFAPENLNDQGIADGTTEINCNDGLDLCYEVPAQSGGIAPVTASWSVPVAAEGGFSFQWELIGDHGTVGADVSVELAFINPVGGEFIVSLQPSTGTAGVFTVDGELFEELGFSGEQFEIRVSGSNDEDTIGLSGCLRLSHFSGPVPPPPACPADLDMSNAVDFADILSVLSAFGDCSGDCPADFDNSGAVDFSDLLTVLSAFGPCP